MNKKQCVRDAPCAWIPSLVVPGETTLASLVAPPPAAPPPPSVPSLPLFVMADPEPIDPPVFFFPPSREPSPSRLTPPPPIPSSPTPAWGWTTGSSEAVAAEAPPSPKTMARNEALARLEVARQKSLKFRDPRFPSAGLMREEGGLFAVLERAIKSGKTFVI